MKACFLHEMSQWMLRFALAGRMNAVTLKNEPVIFFAPASGGRAASPRISSCIGTP